MEMRCYRKILRISNEDHATNEEVRAKIEQAIGPHGDLLTIVVTIFLACENIGRTFDKSFPACVFLFCFLFCLMEISSRKLIPLSKPGSVHSGSAS